MADDEAAADQPAGPEQRLDLLRMRVGRDVEILGRDAGQNVADAAADQVGLEAGIAQRVERAQRGGGEQGTGDRMIGAGDPQGFTRGVDDKVLRESGDTRMCALQRL
jgi:hypothetical protein